MDHAHGFEENNNASFVCLFIEHTNTSRCMCMLCSYSVRTKCEREQESWVVFIICCYIPEKRWVSILELIDSTTFVLLGWLFKRNYTSGGTKVGEPSPPWWIKIVMACLRTILGDESQTIGNSSLRFSSPMLNPIYLRTYFRMINHHIFVLSK